MSQIVGPENFTRLGPKRQVTSHREIPCGGDNFRRKIMSKYSLYNYFLFGPVP